MWFILKKDEDWFYQDYGESEELDFGKLLNKNIRFNVDQVLIERKNSNKLFELFSFVFLGCD